MFFEKKKEAATFEIELVPIDSLVSPPWNPRTMSEEQETQLSSELDEFGLVENIVVNRRNRQVVGGNQRLRVLKKKGHETVPVRWVDLSDEAEKRLNLALNKISGSWDDRKLLSLLEEVGLENTGFDQEEKDELSEMLAGGSEDEDQGDGSGEESDFVTFTFGSHEAEIPKLIYENFESEILRIKKHLYPDEKPDQVSMISALEYMIAQSAQTPLV